jgi:hypothetical protein
MPLPSPQPAQPAREPPATPTELEIRIGCLTAAAVAGLAAAVQDWQRDGDAGAGSAIRLAAGDGIAELVMLKQATAGEVGDFDMVARTQGLQLLQAHCGAHVSAGLLASFIDDVLRIVARVCATQWH